MIAQQKEEIPYCYVQLVWLTSTSPSAKMWKLTTARNAVAYGLTVASSIKSFSARSGLPHHVDVVRTSDSRERIGTRIGMRSAHHVDAVRANDSRERIGTRIGMRSGVPRGGTAAVNHGLASSLTLVSTHLTSAERDVFLDAATKKTGPCECCAP